MTDQEFLSKADLAFENYKTSRPDLLREFGSLADANMDSSLRIAYLKRLNQLSQEMAKPIGNPQFTKGNEIWKKRKTFRHTPETREKIRLSMKKRANEISLRMLGKRHAAKNQ